MPSRQLVSDTYREVWSHLRADAPDEAAAERAMLELYRAGGPLPHAEGVAPLEPPAGLLDRLLLELQPEAPARRLEAWQALRPRRAVTLGVALAFLAGIGAGALAGVTRLAPTRLALDAPPVNLPAGEYVFIAPPGALVVLRFTTADESVVFNGSTLHAADGEALAHALAENRLVFAQPVASLRVQLLPQAR